MNSSLLVFFLMALESSSTFLCRDPNQFLQFLPGYEINIHAVTTQDGYNLHMFQIKPNSSKQSLNFNSGEKDSANSKGKLLLQKMKIIQSGTDYSRNP